MTFGYSVLRVEGAGAKKQKLSLTSKIRLNLSRIGEPLQQVQHERNRRLHPAHDLAAIARIVSSKLTDGDIRGALRALTSDDTFATPTDAVVSTMRDKHPKQPTDLREPQAPEEDVTPLVETETDVKKAINSFPASWSAGLDGIRPAHLRSLLSKTQLKLERVCLQH